MLTMFVQDILSFFFFSSRRRHTRFDCDWSSDVCSSDLTAGLRPEDYADSLPVVALTCIDPRLNRLIPEVLGDRKSTRLNSSHSQISYAVFCLKKKKKRHLTAVGTPSDNSSPPTCVRGPS